MERQSCQRSLSNQNLVYSPFKNLLNQIEYLEDIPTCKTPQGAINYACTKCRNEIHIGDNFCRKCGGKIPQTEFCETPPSEGSFQELNETVSSNHGSFSDSLSSHSLSPEVFPHSIPKTLLPHGSRLTGNLTMSFYFHPKIKNPQDFNPRGLVIESVSDCATLLIDVPSRKERLEKILMKEIIPLSYHHEYGKLLFKNCVGKKEPTRFNVRDYIQVKGRFIELDMISVVFNDPTKLVPSLKFNVIKNLRYLEKDQIDSLNPRIEVLDD